MVSTRKRKKVAEDTVQKKEKENENRDNFGTKRTEPDIGSGRDRKLIKPRESMAKRILRTNSKDEGTDRAQTLPRKTKCGGDRGNIQGVRKRPDTL